MIIKEQTVDVMLGINEFHGYENELRWKTAEWIKGIESKFNPDK